MIRRPPRSTRMTHSFPTRRSSDLQLNALAAAALCRAIGVGPEAVEAGLESFTVGGHRSTPVAVIDATTFIDDSKATNPHAALASIRRSEEHTSELQSLLRISYAVFCLKKKQEN